MSSNQSINSGKDRPLSLSAASDNASDNASSELSAVVDELLTSLSTKFAGVSSEVFAKMDEMSKRLDNLEATLQANETGKGSPTK